MNQRWITKTVDRVVSHVLQTECGITSLIADTLVARGITTIKDAEEFLHPNIDRDWSDPISIPGMQAVADALECAIRNKRRILVFGDFDVDGISATALMIRGLAALGVQADFLIPHRIDEGYGLTENALVRIYEKDPEVVLTVDCGIAARAEVDELIAHGIEVLVTDHHEPSDSVPTAIPVADPKLVEDSPATILAGAGVALKLMALLGQRFDKPGLWRDLLDLAALGTLADLMPLKAENRALVAKGITQIEQSPRPGIAAALLSSKTEAQALTAITLSFTLIPRLNAAGRMSDPILALRLLLTDDPLEAQALAEELEAANENRRAIEAVICEEALQRAKERDHGQKIMIVVGEGWHEGVKGIVASRLVGHLGIPVIVFTRVNGELRGSGRSIGSVNLFKAVESCSALTVRFGGHEAAVGVTIKPDALEEFVDCMESILAQEPLENFLKPLQVDVELNLSAIDADSASQLRLFEPVGRDNEEPLYITSGVFLQNTRAVGAGKNHLSCTITDGRATIQAICFKCPDIESYLAYDGAVDIMYHLKLDEWNGNTRPKLFVVQIHKRFNEASTSDLADEAKASDLADEAIDGFMADPEKQHTAERHTQAVFDHKKREYWEEQVRDLSSSTLTDIASEIFGTNVLLHDSQKEAMEALTQGASVLAIMATGRGKSLVFQTQAAFLALSQRAVSVFIYPLRALIADQSRFISECFERLGLISCSLTGENTTEEKDSIFQRLYEGDVDVLLTTPEFFLLHAWRFAQSLRIKFIVFDEAHHIETELLVGREAYHHLRSCRETFPKAQFLAVTATSDDRITKGICQALEIDRVITDATKRENLKLDDARNLRNRELYLASIVERASKTIIYTNSRAQAVTLARFLRKRTSYKGQSIAFYHAGLTRSERHTIEDMFRSGRLKTIISTNAFGEGVNIPDVTHVVLFHLPFSTVAFNQMSGRAGRSGQTATVHLLFNEKDAPINRQILAPLGPDREQLAIVYQALKHLDAQNGSKTSFMVTYDQITECCRKADPRFGLDEKGIKNSLAIFEELGLIAFETIDEMSGRVVFEDKGRVELSASSRYLEGREELKLFEKFKEWVFTATANELREQIIGPMLPTDPEHAGYHG